MTSVLLQIGGGSLKRIHSLFPPLLVIDETLKTFIILVQVNFNLILDFRI